MAVIAGSLFVMIVGVVIERMIIRHFYSRPHEDQLLVTFGLGICLRRDGAVLLRQPVEDCAAAAAAGRASRRSASCSIRPTGSRCSASSRLRCWRSIIVLYRTRIGMIVRAGIEDSVMVDSLGIDVYKVFMLVFGIGAMAAGFAGIVNAPVVSIAPDVGEAILVQTFVVVVIGGVGSFPGAILGGLIAGEIISITSMFNPGYSYVMLFVAMTLVLVLRPYGLLGTRGPRMSTADLMLRQRPLLVEALTAAGLIAAPFVLPYLGFTPDHDQPHPGLGPVRHRLRHPVRLHRPALVRPVRLLRHRRHGRRLSAHHGELSLRDAGAVHRHDRRRRSSAIWSA